MANVKMVTVVQTVSFQKGSSTILSHYQTLPSDKPDGKPQSRWLFNLQQVTSMNGLSIEPSPDKSEVYAADEKERDEVAEKLLDALILAGEKREELNLKVNEVFLSAL